jgi:hypothetical protein
MAALAADILRRAVAPSRTLPGWALVAVAFVGLAAVGGVTWAAWPGPEPVPEPTAPLERPPETLQARNRRILQAELLPQVVEALRAMSPNGGQARVTQLEVRDFRAEFEIELRHQDAPSGVAVSRFRFHLDTRTGFCPVMADPWGRGQFKALDIHRPIVLLRVPELGIESVLRSEPLERVVKILETFPPDPRTRDEAVRHLQIVQDALAPYRGVWHYRGNPAFRTTCGTLAVTKPDDIIDLPGINDWQAGGPSFQFIVESGGRVRLWGEAPFTLSTDGRRLERPGTDQWWLRETAAP